MDYDIALHAHLVTPNDITRFTGHKYTVTSLVYYFYRPTLATPLYTSITLGSSWGIGHPDTSDIIVPTSVCFSVILSIIMSAKVRLQKKTLLVVGGLQPVFAKCRF